MFSRRLASTLNEDLAHEPAVALLGPRQVGKTTLALEIGRTQATPALYLDLDSPLDLARLSDASTYLAQHLDRLVILDEVHRLPGLFPVLRGLIDDGRRAGRTHGLYLLLGSASLDVLKQSGETLAGRVIYRELGPLHPLETPDVPTSVLWLRGGFPQSLTAPSDRRSLLWRQSFIRTYLERDVPQFGPRVAPEVLRRFWTMLAHQQGALLNASHLARNLGVDVKTVLSYLHLLQDLLLVRSLPPWHANIGKRLVKSPKVYIRDAGLVHALLAIGTLDDLLAHPVVGASWEGFVIESLLCVMDETVQASFYRSSGGAEVDLVLQSPSGACWAIEIKRSPAPKIERGFHSACEDLRPTRKFVATPGTERYRLSGDVEVTPLPALCEALAADPSLGAKG